MDIYDRKEILDAVDKIMDGIEALHKRDMEAAARLIETMAEELEKTGRCMVVRAMDNAYDVIEEELKARAKPWD